MQRIYNDEDHMEYSEEEADEEDGSAPVDAANKAKEIKTVDFSKLPKVEVWWAGHADCGGNVVMRH